VLDTDTLEPWNSSLQTADRRGRRHIIAAGKIAKDLLPDQLHGASCTTLLLILDQYTERRPSQSMLLGAMPVWLIVYYTLARAQDTVLIGQARVYWPFGASFFTDL